MSSWFQEVGPQDIIPEPVLRGVIDVIDSEYVVGGVCRQTPFAKHHTIALWFPKISNRLKQYTDILQEITGLSRPGLKDLAVVWTNDPEYVCHTTNIDLISEVDTYFIASRLHLLLEMDIIKATYKDYESLRRNMDTIVSDAFSDTAPRPFKSLKSIDFYRSYKKELFG